MRTHSSIVAATAILGVLAAVPLAAPRPVPQIRAGVLATWKDLDTWTSYHEDTRETEKGFGLILSGTGGETRMAFTARLEGRYPNRPPRSVSIEASADPRINPNTLRMPTLKFLIDEESKNPMTLDLSDHMTVDNPAPGAMVNDATVTIPASQFVTLAWAETIKANVFMVDVRFSKPQLAGLQKYAESIFLKKD